MGANKKRKTFSLRNYLAIILPFIALMIVSFGCAHRPEVKAPPLPKFTEAELGRIAVIPACFEPEFEWFDKPLTKGKAVGVGALNALKGLWGVIVDAGQGPYGGGAVLWGIVLSPVVAGGGAVYGAIEGKTKETTRKAEETLNHYLTTLRTQEVMLEQVLSLIRERTRYTFIEPEQCGPKFPDEDIRYDSLKGKDIDTVFEISVGNFHLSREKAAIDPPLSLFITVSTRLIRIKDNTVLSSRTFEYKSMEKRKFTKWAKNEGQPFKEELDRCFKSLPERIVDELFFKEDREEFGYQITSKK